MAELDDTIDIDCTDDFKPTMPTVSGTVAAAQRLVRRLSTGRFPFWPNFGFDLETALLSKVPDSLLQNQVQLECEKDEQVLQIEVAIVPTSRTRELKISGSVAEGPFEFTMGIDEAKQTLTAKIAESTL